MKLVLERLGIPQPGSNVLHMAPDLGTTIWLRDRAGGGYDPVDYNPGLYPQVKARHFDLTKDCETLRSDHYDLIVHSHVLEHLRVNIAYTLHHLHRSMKSSAFHVFVLPIGDTYYDEYFGPLPREVAEKRFGQFDHVRVFGTKDIGSHLGSILALKSEYSLYDYASKDIIDEFNIPEHARSGINGNTIFVARKRDYKLWL